MTLEHERVDYILENFDFNKVHQVMRFLNWTWRGEGVPTVEELKSTASYLLHCCSIYLSQNPNENHYSTATGGFEVVYHEGRIRLLFILEHKSS